MRKIARIKQYSMFHDLDSDVIALGADLASSSNGKGYERMGKLLLLEKVIKRKRNETGYEELQLRYVCRVL